MNAIFDSNIVIDYLNGVPQAKLEMDLYDRKSISIVTWIEVMAGTDASDEVPTRAALAGFSLIPLSRAVAELAFTLRRDSRLKLPDAMIFATAQSAGLLFVTRNTRDFDPTDPQIRAPYSI
jgi:predicted nucleic acid-binding protein